MCFFAWTVFSCEHKAIYQGGDQPRTATTFYTAARLFLQVKTI